MQLFNIINAEGGRVTKGAFMSKKGFYYMEASERHGDRVLDLLFSVSRIYSLHDSRSQILAWVQEAETDMTMVTP